MKCIKCESTDLIFTTTRTLTYKVDGVDEKGRLELGELVEEEEVDEGKGDTLMCLKCEHTWHTPPDEDEESDG